MRSSGTAGHIYIYIMTVHVDRVWVRVSLSKFWVLWLVVRRLFGIHRPMNADICIENFIRNVGTYGVQNIHMFQRIRAEAFRAAPTRKLGARRRAAEAGARERLQLPGFRV